MAISFISVRSQNEVMNSNKSNAKAKGNTLSKLASGKRYNHPRDGISEYRDINTFNRSINSYNNLFKNLSQYNSRMEIAIETISLVMEKYDDLKVKLASVAKDLVVDGDLSNVDYVRDKQKREEWQDAINSLVNIINSTVNNTDFLGEKTFQKTNRLIADPTLEKELKFSMSPHDDFTIKMYNVDFASAITAYSGTFDTAAGRYNGDTTDLEELISDDDHLNYL